MGNALKGVLANTGLANLARYMAQVVFQESSSSLTIGSGALLVATGSITASSHATSLLKLKTESLWIGATYGRSNATSTLEVAGVLHAGGDVSLHVQRDQHG